MTPHARKMIAPIVVVICLVSYYVIMGFVYVMLPLPMVIKIIALIVSLIVSGVLVWVMVERIREIKGGEEDDLGKY